ncbi:uracil-DNA glycosylase [Octopus sinensis]|uniref:Uracil-DNA glycosylase n=1 Tax=Octopus sinensis TaxID=2607531 RepID=A0A7E6FKQ3_9MOLL|nr:uracil-DNA glycosylase [Octopus sinensis]
MILPRYENKNVNPFSADLAGVLQTARGGLCLSLELISVVNLSVIAMPGQVKISSFFTPSPAMKRARSPSPLSKFVAAERNKHTIYPPANEVFSWTQLCPLKDIKVIIVGQDPYHGKNQAHGLCFSVKPGVKTPPSLVNIYKELETDIPGFQIPNHGTLTGWAKQGVLLLNSCLTVRASQANSHKDRGWEQLTDAVIRWLNDNSSALVFVLWGAYAQKKGAFINKQKHCILKSAHPSPFSANNGFFGCKHFSKCNAYLSKNNKKTIDWKKVL